MTYPVSPQTRRAFLRLASIGLAGAALAACGAGAPGASTAASPSAASAKPATSAPVSASAKPAASAAGSAAAKPSGNLPTVKVAYPTTGGTHAPLWIAEASGAFAENGVNVQSQFIASDTATKAMVSKDVDILLQSPADVILADLNANLDLVYVGSVLNHSQFSLMVNPAIKTAADLKGKQVGTDKPGSTGDYQIRVLFKLLNLQTSDVQLRVLGGSNVVFPALLSNQIDAAAIIPPFSFQAKGKGYNELANTYKEPYQNVGVVVSKARIDSMADSIRGFLRGYQKGVQLFFQQPDLAKKVLTDQAKVTDPTELQQTYDFYKTTAPFELDLRPTPEGIQAMLDFLGETTLPAARNAKPAQFIDDRFLNDLPKLTA